MFLRTARQSRALLQSQHAGMFSAPVKAKNAAPLVYPFHSRIIENCGIVIGGHNNSPALYDSFISFSQSHPTYQKLSAKSSYDGDVLITKLANLATNTHLKLPKLTALFVLQKSMEYLPKLFSWHEYYALSELTAISLLNGHAVDHAVDLIKRIRPFACKYYHPTIGFSDPMLRSTSELLTLAYIVKGDHLSAQKEAKRLVSSLLSEPYTAPESYLSRAYSILSLVEFLQENFSGAIENQNKAISTLKSPTNNALKAILSYNLWVMHHSLEHSAEESSAAEQLSQTLNATLRNQNTEQFRAFVDENLQVQRNNPSI